MGLLVKYLVAGFVRYWLIHIDYWQLLSNRVEIATPLNSWKRLIEGVYLYDRGINPYEDDSFHASPIMLIFFHYVMKNLPYMIPLLFTVMDLLTAYMLYKTAKAFVRALKISQVKIMEYIPAESKDMVVDEIQMGEIPDYVLSIHLFNPYSVFNCAALTTTVVENLLMATALWSSSNGYRVIACASIAWATHEALYPGLLIVPLALAMGEVHGGNKTVSYMKTIIGFVLCWGYLIYISGCIMNGSYNYAYNTYGFM